MKTKEIFLTEDYDRLIKVVYEGDKLKHIDFMQGTDAQTFDSLCNSKGGNKEVKEILRRLIDSENFLENGFKDLLIEYKYNYAVELYCNAFIYQVL